MSIRRSTIIANKPTLTEKNLPDQAGKVRQTYFTYGYDSLNVPTYIRSFLLPAPQAV